MTGMKRHRLSGEGPEFHPKSGRNPMNPPATQQLRIISKAARPVDCRKYSEKFYKYRCVNLLVIFW